MVVADVWKCISASEDVCACEHVSAWRRSAGRIFLADPLAYSQGVHACVFVFAWVWMWAQTCAFAGEYMYARAHTHTRHEGVLIYSNELGRITRGWGEGRRRYTVCAVGGHFLRLEVCPSIFPHFPLPLFLQICKWDYLHGWRGGRHGRRGRKTIRLKKRNQKNKTGDGEWCDSEADRTPSD